VGERLFFETLFAGIFGTVMPASHQSYSSAFQSKIKNCKSKVASCRSIRGKKFGFRLRLLRENSCNSRHSVFPFVIGAGSFCIRVHPCPSVVKNYPA
jgi:hypothetical protein